MSTEKIDRVITTKDFVIDLLQVAVIYKPVPSQDGENSIVTMQLHSGKLLSLVHPKGSADQLHGGLVRMWIEALEKHG